MALVMWLLSCADALEVAERNCDTRVPYWADADGDGVGGEASLYLGCEAPEGYVEAAGDCDDADPSVTACGDDSGTDTGAAG